MRDPLDRRSVKSSPLRRRTPPGLLPAREMTRTHTFAVTGPVLHPQGSAGRGRWHPVGAGRRPHRRRGHRRAFAARQNLVPVDTGLAANSPHQKRARSPATSGCPTSSPSRAWTPPAAASDPAGAKRGRPAAPVSPRPHILARLAGPQGGAQKPLAIQAFGHDPRLLLEAPVAPAANAGDTSSRPARRRSGLPPVPWANPR